jgi:hypothetical protein
MLKNVQYLCALSATALALSAQTASVGPGIRTFGMVGLAEGQTAQLNLLNPGVAAPAVGVTCSASVAFLDGNGTVLKTGAFSIAPGKSAALDLRADADLALSTNQRREIRATIMIPGVVPVASNAAATPVCRLFPTLEIFDTVSGRTLVTLGHTEKISPTP